MIEHGRGPDQSDVRSDGVAHVLVECVRHFVGHSALPGLDCCAGFPPWDLPIARAGSIQMIVRLGCSLHSVRRLDRERLGRLARIGNLMLGHVERVDLADSIESAIVRIGNWRGLKYLRVGDVELVGFVVGELENNGLNRILNYLLRDAACSCPCLFCYSFEKSVNPV